MSAGSFTATPSFTNSTCCRKRDTGGRPSSICSNSTPKRYLVDRAQQLAAIDLRWRNKVTGLEQRNDHVVLAIETPEGPYWVRANYVVACDGARSSLRQMVGAEFTGQVFEDQFLIADVRMTAEFPTERWFWFDPPFHAGRSALLHKQPDDIWRIDLQLNPDADPAIEKRPDHVRPRIARMLGHDQFDFEWISLYKFQCRRMEKFLHGRVIFAGDAAHQVSPFGARGANSGLEDAENLAWKLDRVLRRTSPETLLDTYHAERSTAADENIRESTRSTDFMAPVSAQEARLRKAVLSLARETEFGKRMINGGRLSVPSVYDSPLSTADRDDWRGGLKPGASMLDAPLAAAAGDATFLTEAFIRAGTRFALLEFSNGAAIDPPDGVGVIRIGGGRLFRLRRVGGRALRCRTGHSLSVAPRRLCRGAVPAADAGRDRRRAGAGHRRVLEVTAMALSTSSNFARPDDAFRAIVEAHRGLSDPESADLDAALVLILANHIGDLDVLREAIALARRRTLDPSQQQQQQQQ